MQYYVSLARAVILPLFLIMNFVSCTEESVTGPAPMQSAYDPQSSYGVTYLVSDVPDQYPGSRGDPLLMNGWGITADRAGTFWVAAEGSGYILAMTSSAIRCIRLFV